MADQGRRQSIIDMIRSLGAPFALIIGRYDIDLVHWDINPAENYSDPVELQIKISHRSLPADLTQTGSVTFHIELSDAEVMSIAFFELYKVCKRIIGNFVSPIFDGEFSKKFEEAMQARPRYVCDLVLTSVNYFDPIQFMLQRFNEKPRINYN